MHCAYPTLRQHGIGDPIELVRNAIQRGLGVKPAPPQEKPVKPPKDKLKRCAIDSGRGFH